MLGDPHFLEEMVISFGDVLRECIVEKSLIARVDWEAIVVQLLQILDIVIVFRFGEES
jgi:hypothetical protein